MNHISGRMGVSNQGTAHRRSDAEIAQAHFQDSFNHADSHTDCEFTVKTRVSNKHERTWNIMLQELIKYKEDNGDCQVPQTYKKNRKLGRWVLTQRVVKSKLAQERRKKLEEIGFVWHASQSNWDSMYQDLIKYKEVEGDCLVPQTYAKQPKLGRWVHKQRERKHMLTQVRVQMLEKIGFVWSSQTVTWNKMFRELSKFRDTHGTCRVPYNYEPNPQLGRWVYFQRKFKLNHSVTRINELESLAFEW